MLKGVPLHVVSPTPDASGAHTAITVLEQPGVGVLVWSGLLSAAAVAKPAAHIDVHDYLQRQTASFSTWSMLWPYYESHVEFAPLVPQLRQLVEQRRESDSP